MMELKVGLWTVGLFCLVAFWVYANSRLEIDYERHIQLVDQETGAKHKPSELLDLAKIIHHTPSYINSTNAIERLYDSSYLATFENPFVIDQSYSSARELQLSGWPVANAAHCTSQLAWIRAELARLAANDSTASGGGYWTARGQLGYDLTNFMDSFGRPEAGFFAGSIHWLGSYKQCLQAGLGKQLRARYCIAKMRFKSWPQHENIYPETRIRVGVCLPESCDTLAYYASAATRQHINELSMFNLPEKLSSQLETDALVCLPDERSPLRRVPPGGRVLLVAVGAWLALVFAATVVYESIIRHDQLTRRRQQLEERQPTTLLGASHEKYCAAQDTTMKTTTTTETTWRALLEQIISAISIRNSIKTFKTNAFRVKHRDGQRVRLNLGALDFFKANMTLMVVLAHAGYLATTHARSISNRIEISAGDLGFMGMSVARCVDTFFLFFGILTSYNVLKKFPEERQLANPLVWLAVNVGIFIRVAPIFMLVFWYAKLLAPSVGSGPWWDYAIDHRTIRGTCRDESWWKSIPYFGCSGKPGVPACNLPSWFIVSYSQLSLLMPPITYLLYKLPAGRAPRLLLVGGLLTASAGSIGWRLAKQTSVREDGLTLYGAFLADLLEKFESTGHLTTLGRLGAVTAGCLVGYLLRAYEEGRIRVWPRWVTSVWINWACALTLIAMAMLPFAGHRIHLLTGRLASLNEFVATNVVIIFVWPILVSILVVSCVTTYNHTVWMRFLSHSFWHVFNRLGLCVFLIHWEVLYTVITAYEHAPTYGFMADIMKLWAFGVFFSLLFALPMHILIEAPIASLLMIVYRHLARNPSVQLTPAAMLIKQASAQPTATTTEKVSTTSNADYVQALQHCC